MVSNGTCPLLEKCHLIMCELSETKLFFFTFSFWHHDSSSTQNKIVADIRKRTVNTGNNDNFAI